MSNAVSQLWNDESPRPGWQQMAIDRTLADRAARHDLTVFRLYRWERSTLSLGANEAARRTWDRERLERLEVPVVRRPTGGRGVWHGEDDLTYAVTAPLARFGDLRMAYRLIHEQLARALATLVPGVSLAPPQRRPTLAPGACFELAVGGEVMAGERKAIGSAQALFGGSLLQHGAIARCSRAAELARFRLDSPPRTAEAPVAELPCGDRLAAAILAGWLADGAEVVSAEWAAEIVEASEIHAARFRDAEWSWRR